MPNFVQIGQSVAKILKYFDFSRWRPPLSWTVEFAKFYWLTVSGGPRRITVPNFVNIDRSVARYCDFSNFQKGRRRHFGFLKSRNSFWGPEGGEASACQISTKSVNRF